MKSLIICPVQWLIGWTFVVALIFLWFAWPTSGRICIPMHFNIVPVQTSLEIYPIESLTDLHHTQTSNEPSLIFVLGSYNLPLGHVFHIPTKTIRPTDLAHDENQTNLFIHVCRSQRRNEDIVGGLRMGTASSTTFGAWFDRSQYTFLSFLDRVLLPHIA